MLLPGDLVVIRRPSEILATLDREGTLDGLPFMAEMTQYCGQRFRVLRRLEKTCYDASPMEMRSFQGGGVVFLEGLHCSGDNHGGCQKGCLIFWKEAWVRKCSVESPADDLTPGEVEPLLARAKTTDEGGGYFCQSTEMLRATLPLSRNGRLLSCLRDVQVGTYSWLQMLGNIIWPTLRKLRYRLRGEQIRGTQVRTPGEALNLQRGEWVEVKSLEEIVQTLDTHGKNRGLHFSEDMAWVCGKRFQVRGRLDRMIVESTGQMRALSNTVILDEVRCRCPMALGGCPRGLFQYWREIWLKRVPPVSSSPDPSQKPRDNGG
ncbi:MAG TPA: hypothetical protein PLX89_21145 [Verrucomicrobiota bacterium]|nr:hypothetical protein [Verrucomicrobiales bacterium]HRI15512.1 hypothetical protein [Verrucomicrobiota bacterium]